MIVQPIFAVWVILIISIVLLGFTVWRIISSRERPAKVAWIRRAAMVVLVGLIAIGPSVPGGYSPAGMMNLDVIFVVDTTTSMAAEDYNGSQQRIEGVRQDIIKLSDKMVGARFAIITFDTSARVLLPMTSDRSSLNTIVSSIVREGSAQSKGSSIDQPIDAVVTQLAANKKQNPQRPNLVFYMGDGEQTVKDSPKSFEPIAPYISGGAVLGYGTTSGGKMKHYFGYGDGTKCEQFSSGCYVTDNSTLSDAPALSKMNPQLLKNIADQMKVSYADRNNGGDISAVVKDTKAESIADSTRQVTHYNNLYFIFALPLVALLVWELLYIIRKIRSNT